MSTVEQLNKEFIKGKAILTGVDSGNTSTKVSVLNQKGDIETFQFPTVIANAPKELAEITRHQSNLDMEGVQRLHVKITSDAITGKSKAFYVGEYAKDKKEKQQPNVNDTKKANTQLHIVTTLTALAVAAWETGKEGDILAPFSGGLPIREIQEEAGMKYLKDYIGEHTIEAIDGPYQGKIVKLIIKNGIVNVEGVTSELGLSLDIKKGEIHELTVSDRIADEFAVVDGGAGTLDIGLFDEHGFNATMSKDHKIGTNPHIDRLMHRVETEVFESEYQKIQGNKAKYIEAGREIPKPYKTREEFMREVVFPGVKSMLVEKDPNFKPSFTASWGKNTKDITELVLETMESYANEVMEEVDFFELDAQVKTFIFVGGGLLFGYYVYRNLDSKFYIFPDDIEKSSAITSNAYLIRNYLTKLEELESKTSGETVKA